MRKAVSCVVLNTEDQLVNVDNGKIIEVKDGDESKIEDSLMQIDLEYATVKQIEKRQVSLKDHTSELGKQLTNERRKRGLTKKRYRRLRKQGKLK